MALPKQKVFTQRLELCMEPPIASRLMQENKNNILKNSTGTGSYDRCCRRQAVLGRGCGFGCGFVACYEPGDGDERAGDKRVPDSAKKHCPLGVVFVKDTNELN